MSVKLYRHNLQLIPVKEKTNEWWLLRDVMPSDDCLPLGLTIGLNV